uniref:E protein transcript B n=1 Tax=Drosophila melanogaster TaxID=7227 RepID=Q9N2Q2_DROME|nr:E protein transcript B [Drosophila melanogaster]
MYENFFQDNQVNYFGVIGVGKDDQVEITSNAFSHNKGGFPNIEIRNVLRVFLREKFLTGADYKLLVEDVTQLSVFSNALQKTNLDCSLKRIKELNLMKNAFNPGVAKYGINLRIEDSNINQLGIFGVSMGKVSLLRCHIDMIMSNAFDVTSIKELIIEGCNIEVIESQALTNKLHSDKVAIVDTVIGTIEGQAISQSGITTMIMFGNTITKIRSNAIQIVAISLFIRNNSMSHVEPNWLSVSQADQVEIANNRFEDYGRCELNIGSSNCSFRNNILQNPQSGSLNFTCRVHQVRVGTECSCNKSWLSELTDHDLESEIMCQVAKRDANCFNATNTDVRRYVNEACGSNVTRYCMGGQWVTKAVSDHSSDSSKLTIGMIALEIVILTLLLVAIVCVLAKNCGSGSCAPAGGQSTDNCLIEEDIRNSLRQLALHSESNKTRKAILKLINGHLSKGECNDRILFIVDNMPQNQAIESLLFRHISQSHMEPSDSEAYASTALTANATAPPLPPSTDSSEPIYQELDQQRLIIDDKYSLPLNSDEDPPYSEPSNMMNTNDMPPAYQYATPMRILPCHQMQHQQPSTTANYAIPVWRSTPSATPTSRPPSGSQEGSATATAPRAVKDLRQALQNSPQFHPNQLTSTRNQRQILQILPPLQPPPYTQRSQVRGQRRRSFECLDGAASLAPWSTWTPARITLAAVM